MVNILITLVSCSQPFWSTGHIWSFYILWCTWLIQTHRWVEFNSRAFSYLSSWTPIYANIFSPWPRQEHPSWRFILNYFSIISICNVGFSMIRHLLSSYITVLNTNAISAQVLQLKTISNEVLILCQEIYIISNQQYVIYIRF